MMEQDVELREQVRARYAESATAVAGENRRSCDCGNGECCDPTHN